jgi:hypothetical protein
LQHRRRCSHGTVTARPASCCPQSSETTMSRQRSSAKRATRRLQNVCPVVVVVAQSVIGRLCCGWVCADRWDQGSSAPKTPAGLRYIVHSGECHVRQDQHANRKQQQQAVGGRGGRKRGQRWLVPPRRRVRTAREGAVSFTPNSNMQRDPAQLSPPPAAHASLRTS